MPTTPPTIGLLLSDLAEREERIFPSYPQVGRYFPAASIDDARNRLSRAIERGDGPGLVIGGPGTGKSLLLQVLASQFHDRFDVVLPACARLCTRRALLQAILFELGLQYRVRDEGDLRLSLLDHLLSREECPSGLLLLVDEAQTLSISLLDELRVLTNLVRGGSPRVRLVLAGSSVLEECFAHPELESFSQRLSTRCYLGPFGRDETGQFVRAQITATGASPHDVFADDAWDAIFEATDGVPRLVNQLCDRSLVEAAANGRTKVNREIVQSAWADIQQLPAPWETPAPTTAPSAPLQVVEFGSLDDDLVQESEPGAALFVVDRSDDDESLLTEPTELDCEEGQAALEATMVPSRCLDPKGKDGASNPFAEEFEEEEVVLDSFASWDNMFRRDAPRVQNRRDPEFSALVEAAIPTTTGCEPDSRSTGAAVRMLDAEVDELEIATIDLLQAPEPECGDVTNWPPLRLAFSSDTVLPTPLVADDTSLAAAWSDYEFSDRSAEVNAPQSAIPDDEEPVLIVEDDNLPPKPPVRREEYRNLFSRLRSG